MSRIEEVIAFINARLAEDELWALEASRNDDGKAAEGGAHWEWVEPDTDAPVQADPEHGPVLEDSEGDFRRFSLRSVEEFPTEHVGPLPMFVIHSAEEVMTAAAGHIVRHHPARVLRDVESKRQTLAAHWPVGEGEVCLSYCHTRAPGKFPCRTLRLLALPYDEHPDYREEWRP